MATNKSSQHVSQLMGMIKSFQPDAASYRQLLSLVGKVIPSTRVLLVTTMPRGSTQIAQPANCPADLLRSYAAHGHSSDRATWQVILRNKAMNGAQCWGGEGLEHSEYYTDFMQVNGLAYVAAAPLSSPILAGYAGALHVYRTGSGEEFSAAEVKLLSEIARRLDAVLVADRARRLHASMGLDMAAAGAAVCRQFVFDKAGRQVRLCDDKQPMDAHLGRELRRDAQKRVLRQGRYTPGQRVLLRDATGQIWPLHAIAYKSYSALGSGPYVIYCLQPEPAEWTEVRPGDFQADEEIVRIIPTLKFMRSEFARSPHLGDISSRARLSPFHFHRRFTELLGQTPKHFMLECQIIYAKSLLLERRLPLIKVAAVCGFAHQSHFTSRFKQAVGLTPTKWRRMAGMGRRRPALKTPGCTV